MAYRSGDPHTREAARQGGYARAAALRAKRAPLEPFAGTILDALDAAGLVGPSWAHWRVLVKAARGLPMDAVERAVFTRYTARHEPPSTPVRQVYAVCGRRAGKTRVAAVVAMWVGVSRDYRALLAPGETAVVPLLAADKRQARQALDYVRGLARMPAFAPYVGRVLRDAIELRTGCTLEVKTASYRLVRGFSVPAIVADELAFWWQGAESANPDVEVLAALLPAMAAMPEAQLWAISTPYAKSGALYEAYSRSYGVEGADVLVWQAPSREMNATLDAAEVERALERDPESASAEWLAQFRLDVATFLSAEAYEAAVNRGRPLELPPRGDRTYVAFTDPSGGASDAYSLAIAHREEGRAVLDLVREAPAPCNPDLVTREYATVLKGYGVGEVTGDRYAAEWVAAAFAAHGIGYRVADRTRSQLYLELLGPLHSGRVEVPPHTKLRAEFLGLERHTTRAGQDSVDHRVGGHDDLCNAAAGALVLAGGGAAFAGWNVWEYYRQDAAARGVASALAAGPAPPPPATHRTLEQVVLQGGAGAPAGGLPIAPTCPGCGLHLSAGVTACPTCRTPL